MVSEKEKERLQGIVAHTSNILADAYILHKAVSGETEKVMEDVKDASENKETQE